MFGQFWQFDFTIVIGFGCWSDGSYTASLLLNIALVVAIVVAVYVDYHVKLAKLERRSKTATEEEFETAIKLVFDKIDADGTGIDKAELTNLCTKNAPSATPEQIDTLFNEADKDGGGRIDFTEFFSALDADGDGESNRIDLRSLLSKAASNAIAADAAGRVSLLVFLLYPGLTQKIFKAFIVRKPPSLPLFRELVGLLLIGDRGFAQCRSLGLDMAVLTSDYSIVCESNYYNSLAVMCSILVILWPFGLPAFLLYKLWGARVEILAEDADTLAQYDFVLSDYKTEYYYWCADCFFIADRHC